MFAAANSSCSRSTTCYTTSYTYSFSFSGINIINSILNDGTGSGLCGGSISKEPSSRRYEVLNAKN
jgi:hypothetical protein